jgi:hypothetical protein
MVAHRLPGALVIAALTACEGALPEAHAPGLSAPLLPLLEGRATGGVASDVHASILETAAIDLWALWIDLGQPWSRTP